MAPWSPRSSDGQANMLIHIAVTREDWPPPFAPGCPVHLHGTVTLGPRLTTASAAPPTCPCTRQPTPRCSLEHGDEEVEQQDVGEEQVEAEKEDRQPLGESRHLPRLVTLGALGLVGVRAVGAALVHVEIHAWSWEWGWASRDNSAVMGAVRKGPWPSVTTEDLHGMDASTLGSSAVSSGPDTARYKAPVCTRQLPQAGSGAMDGSPEPELPPRLARVHTQDPAVSACPLPKATVYGGHRSQPQRAQFDGNGFKKKKINTAWKE